MFCALLESPVPFPQAIVNLMLLLAPLNPRASLLPRRSSDAAHFDPLHATKRTAIRNSAYDLPFDNDSFALPLRASDAAIDFSTYPRSFEPLVV